MWPSFYEIAVHIVFLINISSQKNVISITETGINDEPDGQADYKLDKSVFGL